MKELEDEARELKRMSARRILKEVELRRAAGQHQLVGSLLENFPPEEVEGVTLQQVREMLTEHRGDLGRLEAIRVALKNFLDQLHSTKQQELIADLVEEMVTDLSHNNLSRF